MPRASGLQNWRGNSGCATDYLSGHIWSKRMWYLLQPSYRTMLSDSDAAIGGMAGFLLRRLLYLCEKNRSESFRDIHCVSRLFAFLVHCLLQTWPWKPAIEFS